MSVKYLKLEIKIHGIDIKEDIWSNFLVGWTRECIRGCLLEKNENDKGRYNFRDLENDIEVELVEKAGEYDITHSDS